MAVTDRPEVSRLEVVETGRRRRWTEEEKLRIVTESLRGLRLVDRQRSVEVGSLSGKRMANCA